MPCQEDAPHGPLAEKIHQLVAPELVTDLFQFLDDFGSTQAERGPRYSASPTAPADAKRCVGSTAKQRRMI
jgi:hypothetical protein